MNAHTRLDRESVMNAHTRLDRESVMNAHTRLLYVHSSHRISSRMHIITEYCLFYRALLQKRPMFLGMQSRMQSRMNIITYAFITYVS